MTWTGTGDWSPGVIDPLISMPIASTDYRVRRSVINPDDTSGLRMEMAALGCDSDGEPDDEEASKVEDFEDDM